MSGLLGPEHHSSSHTIFLNVKATSWSLLLMKEGGETKSGLSWAWHFGGKSVGASAKAARGIITVISTSHAPAAPQ